MSLIQRVISDEHINQNIKYEVTRLIQILIPFIFICNNRPASDENISTLRSKLRIIDIN